MSTLRQALRAAVATVTLVLGATGAAAMTVTPMQVEMSSVGSTSRATITVLNDSARPLPVDISLETFTQNEAGERKFARDDQKEFLILPPQALIPSGGSQVFRIQWVGEPMLPKSHSYMLFINQVPVKLQPNQSKIQQTVSMGAMINVAPPKGQATLRIVSTGIETDKKTGMRVPTVTVENPTNTHALLPKSTLQLQSGSWQETLTHDFMSNRIGIGLVPAGQRRKFALPVAMPQNVSSVQASISYGTAKR